MSRGLGDVYKRQPAVFVKNNLIMGNSFYPEKEEIVAQMLNE